MSHDLVVLAGSATTRSVTSVARSWRPRLNVKCARTVAEAAELLANGSCRVLVAALGTQTGVDTIVDSDGRIPLFDAFPGAKIVYSHTACQNPRTAQMCEAAGAHAVVADSAGLRGALHTLLHLPPQDTRDVGEVRADETAML